MAKIEVHIYTEEIYPVYFIGYPADKELFGDEVMKIDDALYQKYLKAKKAWDEVQAELKVIY